MTNYYTSIIRVPSGEFTDLPSDFEINGVKVSFSKQDTSNNSMNVTCDFGKSDLSQQDALRESEKIAKAASLKIALKNNLFTEIETNRSGGWRVKDTGQIRKFTCITLTTSISKKLDVRDIDLMTDEIKQNHLAILDLFNNALLHHRKNDDWSTAFWLYLVWEAMQREFADGNEQNLKKKIQEKKIATENQLKSFKYAIGKYYRHKKKKQSEKQYKKQSPEVITIEKCIGFVERLLKHFLYSK